MIPLFDGLRPSLKIPLPMRAAALLWITACLLFVSSTASSAAPDGTVATVNGQVIHETDLETLYLVNGVEEAARPQYREALVDQLIDRALIEGFLKSKKVSADSVELDAKMNYVRRNIEKSGRTTADVLKKLGLTEATLRQQVALPIAWAMYCRQTQGAKDVADYFATHRAKLDGTKVRIRQIVRIVPRSADESRWKEAESEMAKLRESIARKEITAEEAARKSSDSPSREDGGLVDWFGYDGKMPRPVTDAAFALKPEELSPPIRSPFGVHLIQLVERRPGQLSAEDVRPQILEQLTKSRWDEMTASLRKSAKITRSSK